MDGEIFSLGRSPIDSTDYWVIIERDYTPAGYSYVGLARMDRIWPISGSMGPLYRLSDIWAD